MNLPPSASWLAPLFRGAAVFALILLFSGLFASPTQAVTITGSTYASDTGDPAFPPTGTPHTPQSTSFNITNLTSAAASIRSDVTTSHAQSLATASIASGTLVKSTSGRGWVDTVTPAYNNRGDLWNASASGTQLILNDPGAPSGTTAPFTFSIPGTTPVSTIPFPPSQPTDPSAMLPAQPGQQGFFANNGNPTTGNPTPLPAFMDEYLHVDATVRVGASILFQFNGDLGYNPGNNTFITPSTGFGDFAALVNSATATTNTSGNGPLYSLILNDLNVKNIMVPVNTQFDAIINMSMSMGDPSFTFNGGNNGSPPPSGFPSGLPGGFDTGAVTTSSFPSNVGPIGAGGSFAVQFGLDNSSGNFGSASLEVVPEPSSLLLAAIGLAAGFGLRRRLRIC